VLRNMPKRAIQYQPSIDPKSLNIHAISSTAMKGNKMNTSSKQKTFLTVLTVILMVYLSACGPTATPVAPTQDINVIYTQAAATIVGGITQTAVAMPTATPVPPTATLEASATPTEAQVAAMTPTQAPAVGSAASTATPVPVDPATAFGCYNAAFVAHVTQPYAPAFKPGDKFTKTWRVKNTGTCDWPRGFMIVFVSGDRFGADNITIGQKVTAGSYAEISLNMTAPYLSGVVSSNWQLATDIGKPFGSVLTASITLPGTTSTGGGSGGCLNSELVSSSVNSGTKFDPDETFDQVWVIKNTGTCTWNGDYKITFIGGDSLGSDTRKIRREIGPGGTIEISLSMEAPSKSGTYTSSWQMASDSGAMFGQVFGLSIIVK
jgi:hypothetical protein